MSKQQGSASGVQSTDAFEWEVYHDSETNIFELSKKLPEDLVASLAREVILRVASRTVAAGLAARPVSQEELLAFSTALASDIPKSAAQIIAAEREAGRPTGVLRATSGAPGGGGGRPAVVAGAGFSPLGRLPRSGVDRHAGGGDGRGRREGRHGHPYPPGDQVEWRVARGAAVDRAA